MAKARKTPPEIIVDETAPVEPVAAPGPEAAAMLRLPELLDRVVARSGAKKKDARAVVEATLAVLGEALSNGEGLNLPALGKARVNRTKETPGGDTMVVKLRRTAPKAVKVAPAEAAAE
ncbi:MAG: HU family DNA-binding protein [Gemmobacter sp.]